MQHPVQAEPGHIIDVDSPLPALDAAIGPDHAAITIEQTEDLRHRIERIFPLIPGYLQRSHRTHTNLQGLVRDGLIHSSDSSFRKIGIFRGNDGRNKIKFATERAAQSWTACVHCTYPCPSVLSGREFTAQ